MRRRVLFCGLLLAGVSAAAQMPSARSGGKAAAGNAGAGKTAAGGNGAGKAASVPLSDRERVVQLLDRFTYGARPGEVDRVLAMGADRWLAQQMAPESIKDDALNKRLADYPTLGMTPAQVVEVFPDRPQVDLVSLGRVPYPSDPLDNAVMEVLVAKRNQEQDAKKQDGSGAPRPMPSEAEVAAKKAADQATASRMAGELLAMPKGQRMGALIRMPVEDRIAFTGPGNLPNDEKNLLVGDFSPREREAFYAMSSQVNSAGNVGRELAEARVLRDVMSERQLQQVMTNFWFNHFNVFAPKDSDQWYTTSYERDAIRRNALGKFRDLLLATAESPAMMVYLDNWLSVGPDSQANGVNPANPNAKKGNKGLNENYGREVMELHTVGVGGGYSQADVTALSAILTGWGVDRPNQGGPFAYDPKRHEPGTKTWFGYQIDDAGNVTKGGAAAATTFGPGTPGSNAAATPESMKQGVAALEILARSPQTAKFISMLMAQYFVADAPPPALVDRLTKVFLSTDGDIKAMVRAIAASPEFNSRQFFHNKVKTPEEFVASAFRATATEPVNPGALVNTVRVMGMPLYNALPPTGYYLTADVWMNSKALVDRLNFAYQLTTNRLANQKFDSPKLLAIGMMTPSAVGTLGGLTRPVAAPAAASGLRGRWMPVGAADTGMPGGAASPGAGAEVAMRVLEATVIEAPVSAQTNELIEKQMAQQPAGASVTDTLNVLTALVLGAPEFQMR